MLLLVEEYLRSARELDHQLREGVVEDFFSFSASYLKRAAAAELPRAFHALRRYRELGKRLQDALLEEDKISRLPEGHTDAERIRSFHVSCEEAFRHVLRDAFYVDAAPEFVRIIERDESRIEAALRDTETRVSLHDEYMPELETWGRHVLGTRPVQERVPTDYHVFRTTVLPEIERLVTKLRETDGNARKVSIALQTTENPLVPTGPRFKRHGDAWDLAFDREVGLVRSSLGMEYIWYLLSRPNPSMSISPVQLRGGQAQSSRGDRIVHGDEGVSFTENSFQPVLDEKAKSAYRERLKEIDLELTEANDRLDVRKSAELQREKEQIIAELQRAVGMHDRRLGQEGPERQAAKAIRQALDRAYDHIEEHLPALADHVRKCIAREGNGFAYRPGAQPPRWLL